MTRILHTLFFLSFSLALNAQVIGIKGGLNVANTRAHSIWDMGFGVGRHYYFDNLIRPTATAYAEVSLSKQAIAEVELGFLGFGRLDEASDQINYLGAPVSLKYRAGRVQIFGGGYVGYRISKPLFPDMSTWDYGIQSGIELMINDRATIGIRYFYGLESLYPFERSAFFDAVHNRALQFYLSFPVISKKSQSD
jgi:hypothetical protein